MPLCSLARRHPLRTFFALAYAGAWLLWLPLLLSRTGLGWLPFALPMPAVVPGTFAPTLAALLTHRLSTGHWRYFRWAVSVPHLLVGLLLGLGLIFAAFVLLPSAWLTTSGTWQWAALAGYPAAIGHAILLAAGPLGEEPGWRGYALPRLEPRYGRAGAALVLGLLWAGWHAPLFLLPAWSSSPPLLYAGTVVGLSAVLALTAACSRQNIVAAIVLHAAFNASPAVLGAFLATSEQRAFPSFEAVLCASFLLVGAGAGAVLLYLDRRLGPRRA